MRAGPAFALMLGLAPALAQACGGETVMACRIGQSGKAVEVCLQNGSVSYSYGLPGRQPDLVLSVPVAQAAYLPWNGIGRSIYEEIAFHNGPYSYAAWMALDRMIADDDPADRLSGGVEVTRDGAPVASLACDPATISGSLDTLYGAKERAGQCWDMNAFVWRPCAN